MPITETLQKTLSLPRASLFIADDVGLGNTIQAGLVLTELMLRQRVDFSLIVCPASVCLVETGPSMCRPQSVMRAARNTATSAFVVVLVATPSVRSSSSSSSHARSWSLRCGAPVPHVSGCFVAIPLSGLAHAARRNPLRDRGKQAWAPGMAAA